MGRIRTIHMSVLGFFVALALLAGLTGATVASAERPASGGRVEDFSALGTTHGLDRVLRRGCHSYAYSYTIKPPASVWSLEIIISDPRRNQIASDVFLSGDDRTHEVARFTLCKRITQAGVFRIRGKLTYQDGDTQREGFITTSTFRLCKPPKRPGPRPCSRAQQAP